MGFESLVPASKLCTLPADLKRVDGKTTSWSFEVVGAPAVYSTSWLFLSTTFWERQFFPGFCGSFQIEHATGSYMPSSECLFRKGVVPQFQTNLTESLLDQRLIGLFRFYIYIYIYIYTYGAAFLAAHWFSGVDLC